jgi:hypothetical protein
MRPISCTRTTAHAPSCSITFVISHLDGRRDSLSVSA